MGAGHFNEKSLHQLITKAPAAEQPVPLSDCFLKCFNSNVSTDVFVHVGCSHQALGTGVKVRCCVYCMAGGNELQQHHHSLFSCVTLEAYL